MHLALIQITQEPKQIKISVLRRKTQNMEMYSILAVLSLSLTLYLHRDVVQALVFPRVCL